MKAWLKGGIIASIVFLISYATFYFEFLDFLGIFSVPLVIAINFITIKIFGLNCGVKRGCPLWLDISSFFLSLILMFAIGALIGWIAEKIKTK